MSLLFQYNYVLILLSCILGAIGTFSFSPYDFWPAALLSIIGLLSINLNKTTKQTIVLGFSWGIGLFGTGINWIYLSIKQFSCMSIPINILIIIILILYLALYPMFFSGLLNYFWPITNVWRLVIVSPALWQIIEYLRGYGCIGFPWLQFGYSQINGPLKGLIPIFGVETITYLLITISGLLVLSISLSKVIPTILAFLLLLSPLPLRKIEWFYKQYNKPVNVALVQGNIEPSIKWNTNSLKNTLQIYIDASRPYLGKNKIIIWPESTIIDTEKHQKKFLNMLDRLYRLYHSVLITGIIDERTDAYKSHYYNTIIVLGDYIPYQHDNKNRYDKYHLVPFGEFIPIKYIFMHLAHFFNIPMSSFSKGQYIQPPLTAQDYKITATICYEIVFGEEVRTNFLSNTNFLLTISNDSWFGDSIGPWQHLQMARMRALELGRPLLCSTNNGITAVIDATGKIIAHIPQFERKVLEATILPTTGITPYARFGYIPLWNITFIMLNLALFLNFKNNYFNKSTNI
ncbi:Apolipoprotein N-acyltransferase [Candidatus Profftia lariciata]|uniref:apolipoprotein N-acyltransferase n=1 Tax=Candidatus Profftia lariciata TaxID=1987921 RepID=UPI001D020AC6|nr:apolipoprotein N-acyltransferase [Candidatus Profftia lariciata]UDG81309.1 Apolipoprotein N-acyltransferase [Candidatus Profftia lariciata]